MDLLSSSNTMKILYIDDNRLLVDSVKALLHPDYIVDYTCTGREGIERALSVQYALILLDLGLPDMNGLEVCKELRRANISTPVLILTVQKDPRTSVRLLECGADDYMTKPFNEHVLKARITALLRRGQEMQEERIITVADLTLNLTRRKVSRRGKNIVLRKKEFDVLEYLVVNQGHVLTRSMILDHAWEAGSEGWNNTVDVHIKYLRDKIDRPFDKPLIKTAYGIGYMIDNSP